MKELIQYFKEQLSNISLIQNMSTYADKDSYQSHYLGVAWRILNPAIQIFTWWLVFGVMMSRSTGSDVPYLPWLLVGMSTWLFGREATVTSSKSISTQVKLVAKMNFPLSVIPTVSIVSTLPTFLVVLAVGLISAIQNGYYPTLSWFLLIPYFVGFFLFLMGISLINSTLTMIVRDWQLLLQASFNFLMWISGIMFTIQNREIIPEWLRQAVYLNPFYFVADGFRAAVFNHPTVGTRPEYVIWFISLTLLVLVIGSHFHMKLRNQFTDYV
jgi:teichoic acid transport system permease protein